MEIENVFSQIQKIISDVPVVLAGTGLTIPLHIPGMPQLAVHLQKKLSGKYCSDASWTVISSRLDNGIDLESALTQVSPEPSPALSRDITCETWKLISEADLNLFSEQIHSGELLPLSRLLRLLSQSSKHNINIITTNYDRIIEYACDQAGLIFDDRFQGKYIRKISPDVPKSQNIVNLIKVHGSLDYFKNDHDESYAFPMCTTIPADYIPDIIPPGSNKYRSVLQGIHHDLLYYTDGMIKSASGFLCIGYGFNDEQIQATMIAEIKMGKPILVVTKAISDKVASLLLHSSQNYVVVQESPKAEHQTEFIVNGEYAYAQGDYWSVEGLLRIIS